MYPWHRTNKYGAKKMTVGDHTYASQAEGKRGEELKRLQSIGVIWNLRFQVEFPVYINDKLVFKYIADSCYRDKEGNAIVEDVKGVTTPVYNLKKKCVEAYHGITISEYPPKKKKPRKKKIQTTVS